MQITIAEAQQKVKEARDLMDEVASSREGPLAHCAHCHAVLLDRLLSPEDQTYSHVAKEVAAQ